MPRPIQWLRDVGEWLNDRWRLVGLGVAFGMKVPFISDRLLPNAAPLRDVVTLECG
jgi:hypothetical protein